MIGLPNFAFGRTDLGGVDARWWNEWQKRGQDSRMTDSFEFPDGWLFDDSQGG